MDQELWRRVSNIVADALELPPSERPDFVRKACGGDTTLLEHVRTYLDREETAKEEDRNFLQEPIFSLHKEVEGDQAETWTGRQVGPFLLKERIGRGGMGDVYIGERLGDEDVAVKILRPTRATQRLIDRLQLEGRILRNLIHPYIARYLKSGQTGNGLPYIAMQLVVGLPIDKFCDQKPLSISQRLQLFQQVCDAVQFAHRKTVVHCDLKPANILITAEGQPRLLDFGIARTVDDDSTSPEASSILDRGMTPLYASPEQFQGEEPTTAVDVYLLGLLLYELLTGQKAHRPEDDSYGAIKTAVCETLPPRPSRVVLEDQALSRRLAGDLDGIVMKALEKQPEQRYESAKALAEDLQRYLDLQPVHARPATLAYRASKFVRRNVPVVVAAVLLVGFALWMIAQALEISRKNEQLERQNVEITRERDRAKEVREFLVDFLRVPDPSRSGGSVLTVKEALSAAAQHLQSELRDKPEVRAELLDAIGRVFTNLALYADAESLLNDALETRREALGSQHPLVAESLHNLAFLKFHLDKNLEAEDLRRKAIAIQREAFPDGDAELALGLNGLASLLREKRWLDEAEALAEEALTMQRRLLGNKHLDVARTLNTLASVRRFRGDLARAADLYRQSLEIHRDHAGPVDPGVAAVLNNLALVLVEADALPEAIAMHRDALAIRHQLYSADHPRRITSLNNLAIALSLHHEHSEALAMIDQALAMHDRLPPSRNRGRTLRLNRASLLERQGEEETCLATIEPILAELEVDGRAAQVADARSIRAGCLTRTGLLEEAEPMLRASYQQLRELLGDQARHTRQARERIAYFEELESE